MRRRLTCLLLVVMSVGAALGIYAGSGGDNELPEVCDHNMVHVEARQATCTEEGNIDYYFCPGCGNYYSDSAGRMEILPEDTVISATGHKLSDKWDSDLMYHWRTCQVCGAASGKDIHFWDKGHVTEYPTENSPGICIYTCPVCMLTFTETIPELSHTHTPELIEAKDPTESEPGNIEYWMCTGCGLCFEDQQCTHNILKDSTVICAQHRVEKATDSKAIADALHSLKLFLGIGDSPNGTPNYSLDRGLTRAESLVLLIRMLGKEKEAVEAGYSHPFTDTDEWYDSYVGYGYQMGLTNGTGGDTYSGSRPVTAQMFATFCLRALGYKDMGADPDFYWEESCDMADIIGIRVPDSGEYLRRDAVITFWDTMEASIKNNTTTLADKLILEGVFTREAYEKARATACEE